MTRSLQAVTYRRPSALESSAGARRLGLETSQGATPSGVTDHPRFFAGFLTSPRVASAALLAVADVAGARYYQRQLAASLDPVVTAGGDRLRFESFSGCGGVYARLGVRLARWLSSGGPVLPTSRRRSAGARVQLEFGELVSLQADFPAGFRQLGQPTTVYGERWYCYHWDRDMQQHWLAILPELRELVAVRIVREVSTAAVDGTRGAAAVLPLLAESGGTAGEATHLCLAYGLGARHPEDRLAAVDALLVLAAREQLDGARLGTDLGQLVRSGAVKPSRLAESMRTGAATGANTSIWGILRHTLTALLGDLDGGVKPASARGLGDLPAVAAECAERSGARGELPHLAQTADRIGSSRLVMQARRLRSALVAGVAV